MWDVRSGTAVKTLELNAPATSVELSRDRELLTISHGSTITFATSEGYSDPILVLYRFR